MPSRDRFHQSVRQALIRDGWIITDDPLRLEFAGVDLYVDLAAEKLIAAEKSDLKIAVEVKSFISDSITYEFHSIVGQFVNYRIILEHSQPDRILYVAVPSEAWHTFFETQFAQVIVRQTDMKIVVFDPEQEIIETWIN